MLPSPRDSSSPAPLSGVIKAAVGSVFDKMKQNRERERALSTMTQLPDDVAWRQDEIGPSEDGSDAGSAASADTVGGTQQMKRWSAEAAGLGAQKQVRPAIYAQWKRHIVAPSVVIRKTAPVHHLWHAVSWAVCRAPPRRATIALALRHHALPRLCCSPQTPHLPLLVST